jgi:ADP-ribosylglycohydrolase
LPLPSNYAERVYAGVLGKIIGVYLGRPIEGWTYERITTELGQIKYYIHERFGQPLVVADDDIAGTFTFLRALEDYDCRRDITPAQIGQTWLNYLIENRTVLWWGGLGNSTEHTAYLRLKRGIQAPASGSAAINGRVVSEQIGAQIFVDGWAMVAPGDPEFAASLAQRAASVSHDGEAIYAAQLLAAMESQAFVESDLTTVIETGLRFIPPDCAIRRLVDDIREWHVSCSDWRAARRRLATKYGYDKYGGNCHVVPNHGLIMLGLLYGEDSLQQTLSIVNTGGWDTDCNSGNAGCLMGIKNGLAGIDDGPDWRGPVADRLYLSTADPGRAVSDAASEAYRIVDFGCRLAGEARVAPKGGARFHFDFPGSTQGFRAEVADSTNRVMVRNVAGHSRLGNHSLAIHFDAATSEQPARVETPTFVEIDQAHGQAYELLASPSIYSGQTIQAELSADPANACEIIACLYCRAHNELDTTSKLQGPKVEIVPGTHAILEWKVPPTDGYPVAAVGCELFAPAIHGITFQSGTVYLDSLTWDGTPDVCLSAPGRGGQSWRRAWANGVDCFLEYPGSEPYRLIQNDGRGLLIQGAREWHAYRVEADVTPHLVEAAGLAACVQGMRRYYALLLGRGNRVCLIKALDGYQVLGETAFHWEFGKTYQLAIETDGSRVQAWVDGFALFDISDADRPLLSGAIALVVDEGRSATRAVRVHPITQAR